MTHTFHVTSSCHAQSKPFCVHLDTHGGRWDHDADRLDRQIHYAMGDEEGVPSQSDLALLPGFSTSPAWEVLTANTQLHKPIPPA